MDTKLYTVQEFAKLARSSAKTIYRWYAQGKFRAAEIVRPSGRKKGARILFTQKAIERLLVHNTNPVVGSRQYNEAVHKGLLERLNND